MPLANFTSDPTFGSYRSVDAPQAAKLPSRPAHVFSALSSDCASLLNVFENCAGAGAEGAAFDRLSCRF
jgi:hypothetical protein